MGKPSSVSTGSALNFGAEMLKVLSPIVREMSQGDIDFWKKNPRRLQSEVRALLLTSRPEIDLCYHTNDSVIQPVLSELVPGVKPIKLKPGASFVIGSRWLQDAGDETVFSVAVLVYANNERVDNCAQVNFEQTFNPTAIKLPDIRISLRNLFDSRHGQGRTDSFKTSMELIVEMLFARYGTLHVYRAESATESPTLEFELQYGTWLDSAQVSSEGFEDVFIL